MSSVVVADAGERREGEATASPPCKRVRVSELPLVLRPPAAKSNWCDLALHCGRITRLYFNANVRVDGVLQRHGPRWPEGVADTTVSAQTVWRACRLLWQQTRTLEHRLSRDEWARLTLACLALTHGPCDSADNAFAWGMGGDEEFVRDYADFAWGTRELQQAMGVVWRDVRFDLYAHETDPLAMLAQFVFDQRAERRRSIVAAIAARCSDPARWSESDWRPLGTRRAAELGFPTEADPLVLRQLATSVACLEWQTSPEARAAPLELPEPSWAMAEAWWAGWLLPRGDCAEVQEGDTPRRSPVLARFQAYVRQSLRDPREALRRMCAWLRDPAYDELRSTLVRGPREEAALCTLRTVCAAWEQRHVLHTAAVVL